MYGTRPSSVTQRLCEITVLATRSLGAWLHGPVGGVQKKNTVLDLGKAEVAPTRTSERSVFRTRTVRVDERYWRGEIKSHQVRNSTNIILVRS